MNEEIKEILDYLRDENEYYNEEEQVIVNYGELIVEKEDIDKLLNYITNLQEENEHKDKLIDIANAGISNLQEEKQKLEKNYNRIYNENCKLRKRHNITDISLLDENQKLNKIIDELEKWLKERIDRYEYSTGNMNIAAAGTLEATLNKLTQLKNEVE